MKIGAQLYTVREYTKDLKSLAETLKKVADIGYDSVQLSATCAFEAEWMAEQLKKNGLVCAVTHSDPNRILREPDKVAKEHKIFGCEYIGIGCAPNSFKNGYEDYLDFKEKFTEAARNLRTCGVTFAYHNHHMEFTRIVGENNERTIFEIMAEDFGDDITFILDTYWVQYAGADPAEYIEALTGRDRKSVV